MRNVCSLNVKENHLNASSPIPLHHQLSELLKEEILNGNMLDQESKLPAENRLVKKYGVSRITVRKAMQTLVDDGLVVRERGKGTFLRTNHAEVWVGKLMGFSENMEAQGIKPTSKVLKAGKVTSLSDKISTALTLNEAWELERLRFVDNSAIAIEYSVYPYEIGVEFEKQNLTELITYRFIESNLGILLNKGTQEISAVKANDEQSTLLNVKNGEPLLSIERVTFSYEGRPIEYLKAFYRPDYFTYNVSLSREY